MKFLEIINRMKLFLKSIISFILNLIELVSEIFFGDRKVDLIDFLLHFLAYPFICFLVRTLTNELPYHLYLWHLTAIQLV